MTDQDLPNPRRLLVGLFRRFREKRPIMGDFENGMDGRRIGEAYRDKRECSRAFSRTTACACNWQILDSVTCKITPISFMVSSSK